MQPTRELMKVGSDCDVNFTFFVDAGMLCAFKRNMSIYPELAVSYEQVISQIRELDRKGHTIALHIHSHWEDAVYEGGKWVFDTSRYRLSSFSQQEADEIIRRYFNELSLHCEKPIKAFRAGGWCVQPFEVFRSTFAELGIAIDSSLYKDGYMSTKSHQFDFRGMPSSTIWNFNSDPMMIEMDGIFTEIPIASTAYSRFFYLGMLWHRLLKTEKYRMFGDGRAIGGGRKRQLKSIAEGDFGVVSLDSYRCRQLKSAWRKFLKSTPDGHFVVIAHPKALSRASVEVLADFAKAERNRFSIM